MATKKKAASSKAKSRREALPRGVTRQVLVCAGTACKARGAHELHAKLVKKASKRGVPIEVALEACDGERQTVLVTKTDCQGLCKHGPLVHILPDDILYTELELEHAKKIVKKTLVKGKTIEKLVYVDPDTDRNERPAALPVQDSPPAAPSPAAPPPAAPPKAATYGINDDCVGCRACAKACPADAITGEKKALHIIDLDRCTRCGACLAACRHGAIEAR